MHRVGVLELARQEFEPAPGVPPWNGRDSAHRLFVLSGWQNAGRPVSDEMAPLAITLATTKNTENTTEQ